MHEKENLAETADEQQKNVPGGWRIRFRLARLVDVKSLVTLALVCVLCVTTLNEQETNELFNSAVMLVLGFFFGKNLNDNNEKNAG